jgi:hypothetical protein
MLMKFLLLISLVCVLTGSAFKQPDEREDSIEKSKIKIENGNSKIYSLGSRYELKKALGDKKGTKSVDEILGGPAYTYKYKGLKVYFIKQDFESATITNSSFYVILNGVPFEVGDQINKFKKYFPLSYKEKESSNDRNLAIYITDHKTFTDSYVSFAFNKMGVVTAIWIGNDNS